MAQPSFVPIPEADQVRVAHQLEVPCRWAPSRPADLKGPARPSGRGFGKPGPDQGFALRVARSFADRLQLSAQERAQDVLLGASLLAVRRSGAMGRAPSAPDIRWAMELWALFDPHPPADLLAERVAAFSSLSHDYVAQRQLVDRVPEWVLRLTPEEVGRGRAEWRGLTGTAEEVSEAAEPKTPPPAAAETPTA
jgi:hypothetical protein